MSVSITFENFAKYFFFKSQKQKFSYKMFEHTDIDRQLQKLSNFNISELFDAVSKLKIDSTRTKMENLWIESFLRENYQTLSIPETPKSVKFASKLSLQLSVRGTKLFDTFSIQSRDPSSLIDTSLKSETGEQEIYKIERLTKKRQEESFKQLKLLTAKTQENEILCKEFTNLINEFKKFVLGDDETFPQTFSKMLKELTRQGIIKIESIRLKTATLKREFNKRKRLVMKNEEIRSCIRPIDFELALIEKKKLATANDAKQVHLIRLKSDEYSVAESKNVEDKKLFEATIHYKHLVMKISNIEKLNFHMLEETKAVEKEIEEMNDSFKKKNERSAIYEAPSVANYMAKIKEREFQEKKLKVLKRKIEVAKMELQNGKQNFRKK
jgi:hypothetical protein